MAVAHEYAREVLARHHPAHVPTAVEAAARERWGFAVERAARAGERPVAG